MNNWRDELMNDRITGGLIPKHLQNYLSIGQKQAIFEFIESLCKQIIDEIPNEKYLVDITTGDDPIPTYRLKEKLMDKYLKS